MLEFKPTGKIDPSAFQILGLWQGQLTFSNEGSVQKTVACSGLFEAEEQAIECARSLYAAILEQQGPFEFSGYLFSIAARKWEDGFRGYVLLIGTPDHPNMFTPPLDLPCKNYQASSKDARCEAYAEAVRLIQAGIVVRKYNSVDGVEEG